ncbi:hypothetical protein HPB49_011806 [Dermacentor silvarum]|uniref:Uncharacterized protein n=1 Tax=Dermacentor silvarum TaxID=543639 RepID=A0ACB8DCW7_DERSI|nr:hypothetical protein HPB49_011806 [Dermacentor silvarum]
MDELATITLPSRQWVFEFLYATKGAAPGQILAEFVLEAVAQLHKHRAVVITVVSDGTGNNKLMWQRFGVSGSMVNATHKI